MNLVFGRRDCLCTGNRRLGKLSRCCRARCGERTKERSAEEISGACQLLGFRGVLGFSNLQLFYNFSQQPDRKLLWIAQFLFVSESQWKPLHSFVFGLELKTCQDSNAVFFLLLLGHDDFE